MPDLAAAFNQLRDAVLAALAALPGAPTPDPAPDPDPDPEPSGRLPVEVLPELADWTITLDTGSQGDPDNDYPDKLGVVPGSLYVQTDGGVAFVVDVVDGVHTANSKYPRVEGRQMVAGKRWTKAAWKSAGSHSLTANLSLDTRGLTARRRVNGLQIHNGSDDVGQLMLNNDEGKGLGWAHKDGQAWQPIDPGYVDGTPCTVRILAEKDRIKIWYNDDLKVDIPEKGSGWYWKAGAYAQTGGASTYTEPAGAAAKVVIYSLATTGGGT